MILYYLVVFRIGLFISELIFPWNIADEIRLIYIGLIALAVIIVICTDLIIEEI